jgi:hypothetical protein
MIQRSRVALHEFHPDSLQEGKQIDLQPLGLCFVEPWTHFQDRRSRDKRDVDPRWRDTAYCNRRPETSKTASDNDDAVGLSAHPLTVSPVIPTMKVQFLFTGPTGWNPCVRRRHRLEWNLLGRRPSGPKHEIGRSWDASTSPY